MKQIFTLKALLLLLLAGVVSGCVREDTDDCPPSELILRYVYTHNPYYEDRFAEQVDHVDLYIYGEDGELVRWMNVQRENMLPGHRVSLSLDPGRYTIVTWGNLDPVYYNAMDDYDLEEMQVILIEDDEEIIYRRPGSLFHRQTRLEVPEDAAVEQVIELIKDTNDLHILVTEAGQRAADEVPARVAPGTDYLIRVTGNNIGYNCYNTITTPDRVCTYMPEYTILDNGVQADFTVMRILTEDVVWLYVEVGGSVIYDGSLSALLLRNAHISGDDDLDREDDYTIEFPIYRRADGTAYAVNIFVNDWEVVLDQEAGV